VSSTTFQPEIGQIIFGTQDSGDITLPEFAKAAVRHIINEYARVYRNVTGSEFDTTYMVPTDPSKTFAIDGIALRPYYWGDDAEEFAKPNFAFGGVHIWWYKYFGRGMSTNMDWDANRWSKWFDRALLAIRAVEDKEF
jgi:hypothetical protein